MLKSKKVAGKKPENFPRQNKFWLQPVRPSGSKELNPKLSLHPYPRLGPASRPEILPVKIPKLKIFRMKKQVFSPEKKVPET